MGTLLEVDGGGEGDGRVELHLVGEDGQVHVDDLVPGLLF